MQDEQRKLRQLQAAIRLRVIQREKAQSSYERSRREVLQAERLLGDEQARYQAIQAGFEALGRSGVALDPALHEQRLLAQTAAYFQLETRHRAFGEAQHVSQAAKAQWLKCKVDEELVDKARKRVEDVLELAVLGLETIDIFDAQQARGAGHGR
ncbi:hypothetical protein HX882_07850 [Pseudomonas gingeri]|uniref:Uncharacterized protein n=1 Tax=Pseudomonas gingeri TaxID=117681 RepID=A0A7Y7XA25_9PSED|nr:hypothetical protein [Pseudomonas gingeri]NWB95796.1 hypothetical protein [Pseudomonas gingeri]